MFAKLILLAEEIEMDAEGRVSTRNLALDLATVVEVYATLVARAKGDDR